MAGLSGDLRKKVAHRAHANHWHFWRHKLSLHTDVACNIGGRMALAALLWAQCVHQASMVSHMTTQTQGPGAAHCVVSSTSTCMFTAPRPDNEDIAAHHRAALPCSHKGRGGSLLRLVCNMTSARACDEHVRACTHASASDMHAAQPHTAWLAAQVPATPSSLHVCVCTHGCNLMAHCGARAGDALGILLCLNVCRQHLCCRPVMSKQQAEHCY